MRSKVAAVILVIALLSFFVMGEDSGRRPVLVSPGSETGPAVVETRCPTFSWTAVNEASGYKVVVFNAVSSVLFSYEELSALNTPILEKVIKGNAFSWTPDSIRGLRSGSGYIWFVKAIDQYGEGEWSTGKIFRVELPIILSDVEENIREKLKEEGLSDDSINNVFSGVGSDKKSNTDNTPDKSTGTEDANYTYFGTNAGGPTHGLYNAFFGVSAGDINTVGGTSNSFFGHQAGAGNTTGGNNVFIGYQAGYLNDVANWCTFVGDQAGYSNIQNGNVFIGYNSGRNNTSGPRNTFVGIRSGESNIASGDNTFLGHYAGYSSNGGFYNTFVGSDAGRDNTDGDRNSYFGYQAGENTNAVDNTILGYQAGFNNTGGSFNTIVGAQAGYNATGSSNVFIGKSVGYNETGSNRLYIDNANNTNPLIYGEFDNNILTVHGKLGINTKTPVANLEINGNGSPSSLRMTRTGGGTLILRTGMDNVQVGAQSAHGLRLLAGNAWKMMINPNGTINMRDGGSYNGTWNDASSIEFKENIRELSSDEAKYALEELNPVLYNYKMYKDEERVGFIAEHVPEIVANNDRKNISAMDIVAVLTKVVKEQQKINAEQQEINSELQKRLEKLEKNK